MVFPVDRSAPKAPDTVTGSLKNAGHNIMDAGKAGANHLKTGWSGFAQRTKSEGILKGISGLSRTSKVVGATLVVGGLAAVAVRRHNHSARIAREQEMYMNAGYTR